MNFLTNPFIVPHIIVQLALRFSRGLFDLPLTHGKILVRLQRERTTELPTAEDLEANGGVDATNDAVNIIVEGEFVPPPVPEEGEENVEPCEPLVRCVVPAIETLGEIEVCITYDGQQSWSNGIPFTIVKK